MDEKENKEELEAEVLDDAALDEDGGSDGDGTSPLSVAHELLPISLETEMKQSYLDYAMSVIVGRALPDVRDGFKPVHRRVLYAMNELKNTHNNPTKKSARVVGEVLGKYHPHGDSAAYMTVVRMAQPFSLRYPLIYGQGNFGSIDGDSPAAMRYTEVRLMKIASEMLADINEETVDFVPNFDNSEREPVVLPTRLPQLLINGSSGIAVGMATSIPPHNLRETIVACLHYLHHPDCTIDDLIKLMPAPDFPTGGIIFGIHDVHEGYRTGRGRVVMRARTHFEEFGRDRTRIVVDEIPYMVNKRIMYEKMHELVRDKKIEGVAEMRDESSSKIRICIDLKSGVMPEVVLNNLYKMTQMQESFGMNMVALVDGQPTLLNLKQMILHFIAHRREVVTRRTVFRLRKFRREGHLLEGQAVALSNLDEFIRIIRAATTPAEAAEQLLSRGWPMVFAQELVNRSPSEIKKFYPEDMDPARGMQSDGLYYLTRAQVDSILRMNLRSLTGLEQEAVRNEYQQVLHSIADCLDILAKPERVNHIIGEELEAIRDEYGDERRSTVDPHGDPNFNKRDLIPRREMVVTLTRSGFIKSQELDDYNAQIRGGKGRKVQEMTKDDEINELFIANTHDVILCFSTMGRMYPIDVFELPEGKSNARGRPIVNLLPLEAGEQISFILPVQSLNKKGQYLVMATAKGAVKRTPLILFRHARLRGINAISLAEDDQLIGVAITHGKHDVMLFTDANRAVRASESDFRPQGRTARGQRGIRLAEGHKVVSLVVTDNEDDLILTVSDKGFGKRSPVNMFPRKKRGGKGVVAFSSANEERTGHLVAAVTISDDDDVMILSTGGKVIRMDASTINIHNRIASGVRLINLDDDMVLSVRRATRVDEELQERKQPEEDQDEESLLSDEEALLDAEEEALDEDLDEEDLDEDEGVDIDDEEENEDGR